MQNKTGKPACPNHKVPLTDCNKGRGICPLSGAVFGYSSDEFEKTKKLKINALGQAVLDGDWKVQHIEGDDD